METSDCKQENLVFPQCSSCGHAWICSFIQVMYPGANKHHSAVNFRQIQEAQLCWLLLQLAHKCHCYWVDHLNTATKSQE